MEPSLLNHHRLQPQTPLAAKAFTLVELLVTLAIFSVILAVILANQSSFNRSILLTDTAYTVALSVRQAQSFGISSKFSSTINDSTGYGIHIDTGSNPINSYIQFADALPAVGGVVNTIVCPGHTITDPTNPESRPGNCLYDSAGEIVNTYKFSQGYTIGSFCGYIGATSYCSNSGSIQLSKLDITFERPNTQTVMVGTSVSGVLEGDFDTSCIQVSAPASSGIGSRYVEVTKSGQVLVTATCP